MKRTIAPIKRKRILQEYISIVVSQINDKLQLTLKLFSEAINDFPSEAHIYLEAYNRTHLERIDAGVVSEYKNNSYPLNFAIPLRAKINYRLKIIDAKTYHILGYAENLKEENLSQSLLNVVREVTIETIYKLDFENEDEPILQINKSISEQHIQILKPLIAEQVLNEILRYLIFTNIEAEQFQNHKWFKFAKKFEDIPYDYDSDVGQKLEWIDNVVSNFSKQNHLLNKLNKNLEQ